MSEDRPLDPYPKDPPPKDPQDELAQLIAEQARDMRWGDRDQKEHASLETLEPFLAEDGLTRTPRKNAPSCHIHGRQNIALQPNGWTGWRCRICYDIRARAWQRAHPERHKEHKRRYAKSEKGRAARAAEKRRYWLNHKDEINAKRRERRAAAKAAA